MPHAKGYRNSTRYKFAKPFGQRGSIRISNYLTEFHLGDYVDIIVDGAIHKGMPHHPFHGRTGRIYNINPRSVGVLVKKTVRNREVVKRIHVRVEHVRKSKVREAFLNRIRENDRLKHEAKKAGKRISTKRQPAGPRAAHVVKVTNHVYQHPETFQELF
eukprot:TRINITY_DN1562_c0_g1_i1.p2 TRINITY_DN1562_c0_g1~~TRINITY_DN1562_c0_g1_i1.p2  ORF type:complete len:159 (-),score=43.60 TRINITY_DN1562_c0_g1_i1:476-952(-)